jgi:hypothetical protein
MVKIDHWPWRCLDAVSGSVTVQGAIVVRREGTGTVASSISLSPEKLRRLIDPATRPGGEDSVVQNHIEQGFMNPDATVVFNKPELAKAIHEETNPGPGGADHFSQCFLRDRWD